MSSDDQYSSFLDQANQDTGASTAKSKSQSKSPSFKTTDTEIPASLQSVDEYYVSDTDEPFEPVSLSFSGEELSERSFGKLISPSKAPALNLLSLEEFDPQNQYSAVITAVEKAGVSKSKIKVFRVEEGKGSRVQYWIVGLVEGKVVGYRAKAVES